jgi:hypothetical protein
MRARLLFGLFAAVLAASTAACSGDKVQTPTSDKNYDDEGDPGSTNDPGTPHKDGGKDGAIDAAPEAAASDAAPEASTDAAHD